MADKNSYPQIPSTVWWGVRNLFVRSPGMTLTDKLLAVELGVQDVAARQYMTELRRAGILNEDGKATPLAHRWRLEESYAEAVEEIVAATYPEGLRHVAPPSQADRQKAIAWFQKEGLGAGAAANKAATYMLISSREPQAPGAARAKPENGTKRVASQTQQAARTTATAPRPPGKDVAEEQRSATGRSDSFPLNINVQIHISADAGSEQIEAIFSAMRRYLHAEPA